MRVSVLRQRRETATRAMAVNVVRMMMVMMVVMVPCHGLVHWLLVFALDLRGSGRKEVYVEWIVHHRFRTASIASSIGAKCRGHIAGVRQV